MPLPSDPNRRNFFGIGEIISVLANPSETLRSLTESRRMLEETRRELAEARERAQLSPTHTFSALPGFFDRPAELKAIERALEGEPSFTVLFGASSVGKTALLRQVLTRSTYHVLHFDLRIAGFADLSSLYMSLSQQMEAFFMSIAQDPELPGYEVFEKEAWGFKHDRLNAERRMSNSTQQGETLAHTAMSEIKTSDIARLMELFQASTSPLLICGRPDPSSSTARPPSRKPSTDSDYLSNSTRVQNGQQKNTRAPWHARIFGSISRRSRADKKAREQQIQMNGEARHEEKGKGKEWKVPAKKIPVFLIDEAHKLLFLLDAALDNGRSPALIRSVDTMKSLLDAMLVLTKQDRLCHVIHATSDPFYQTWLRQLNDSRMLHVEIITVGDYPKVDTRRFFRERIVPIVPETLRSGLEFERLYEAFGGKLAHWQDYVTDYINANGKLDIKQSSHFLQAHALLNLHIIHSAQAPPNNIGSNGGEEPATSPQSASASHHAIHRLSPPPGSSTGFHIYSPLTANPHAAPPTFGSIGGGEAAPEFHADFTAIQLLKVMNRLGQPGARSLPYFLLCREMGVRAVDGMVKGRILDLRWTDPISKEGVDSRTMSMRLRDSTRLRDSIRVRDSVRMQFAAGSSATAVNDYNDIALSEEGEMVPMTEEEILRAHERMIEGQGPEDYEEEIVGPKLVPITPIMRYAMREVVQDYYDNDDQTVSEYASLSEVEEY
ncbi:uncharacterized protein FIBRA_01367 [Fibroporia radiculosa]|uniref:AAA+ ATPase domain-containing protein n=1 Tax=Fibroporia radiculosa TaxID=599839 RepID=J4H128_9APHY|nr:uncharacterized protein FIBRA_01367 [Fibroporia radiculosa]CCL99349.1 predicted protein [Fibroporia radiculosa]